MGGTKHIRTSYKNAGPLRLGAGRLCGLPADGLGCWRMVWPAVVDGWRLMLQAGGCLPFCVPEMQGGGAAAGGGGAVGGGHGGGVMVCRGWLGMAMIRRQFGGI